MEMKMTKLALAIAGTLGAGMALTLAAVPNAMAQQAPQTVERIEVTGSAIRSVEGETALPVTIIRREEIERSGVTTAAEVINRLSSNNTNGYAETTGLGDQGNPGFAGASLRGLGSNATLVLLNGRRLANFAFGGTGLASNGSVDLNSIPLAAIERIEVLKDGASALYGSDAIGGVINFILRKDFHGAEATVYYGTSEAGGGQKKRATITGGFGDLETNRFNILASVDYQQSGELRARDREFSKTAYIVRDDGTVDKTSSQAFPANILDPNLGFVNPVTGCVPPLSFKRNPNDSCRFDYASVIDIIDPSEKTGTVLRGVLQLAPNHQFYADGTYSRSRYRFVVSPTPASELTTHADPVTGTAAPIIYPAGGRFYPGLGLTPAIPGLTPGDLNVYYRTLELGGRTDVSTVEAYRGVIGLKGILAGWDYDTGLLYSKNTAKDVFTSGYVSENALIAAMATGNINPFGFNDSAGLALLKSSEIHAPTRDSSGTTTSIDAKVSKELFNLPAGPLAFAVGVEARREKLNDEFAPIVSSGDILGGGGALQSTSGSRNVKALYTEFGIPIVKNLDATVSARYDKYSDFGSTTNPKVAIRWQPTRRFLARASYGTGFRAPSLFDLITPLQTANTANADSDPIRCPVTGAPGDCAIQFNTRTGGNPSLKPEKSEQATLGIVLEPTDSISMSIDLYKINKSQNINALTDSAIFGNFAKYDAPGGSVHRFPGTQVVNGVTLPGAISFIDLFTTNLGNIHTDGVDIDVVYRLPRTDVGRLTFALNGTYVHKFEMQLEQGGPYTENAGAFFNGGPVIRWQHYLTLNWDSGLWAATLAQNFQLGYGDDGAPPERRVASYETYDIYGAFSGIKNLRLALGIKNLLDRDPPYSRQGQTFPVGYDPRYTDPRGRFFYGSVTYAFK